MPPEDSAQRYRAAVRAYPELEAGPLSDVGGGVGQVGDHVAGEPAAPPGKFPGNYEILSLIAETQLSRTWRAFDRERRAHVVLKEPRAALLVDSRSLERFRQEVQLVARSTHPHIVPVLTTHLSEPPLFYTMPLIEGLHLDTYCEQQGLKMRQRLPLFLKVAGAVEHAHQCGVIHRDLKPNNILVDQDGEPHLLDFGLGGFLDTLRTRKQADTGAVQGTPSHMSPEQAAGLPGDTRSDVYSLGVILFQLLTKRLPIAPTSDVPEYLRRIREEPPAVPTTARQGLGCELTAILLKALAKDPAQRYASVADLARDLSAFLSQRPISVLRGTARYVGARWVQRNKRAVSLGSMIVAGVIAFTVYALALWRSTTYARIEIAEIGRHKLAVAYGRSQIKEDNPLVAESTLLAEWRRYDSVRTRMALWEFYRRYPCVYHAGLQYGRQAHVAYSPDGKWLVTVQRDDAKDGRLIVYRADTGEVAQVLPAEQAKATCIGFDPQGDCLYVGRTDGRVYAWSYLSAGGQLAKPWLFEAARRPAPISAIAVSGDGELVAAGTEQGQLSVWQMQAGRIVTTLEAAELGKVAELRFSPDGTKLAVACSPGATRHLGGLTVWDLRDAHDVVHRLCRDCRALRWSEDGQAVLLGDDVARRWNIGSNSATPLCSPVQWGVRALDLTGDGSYLAVAGGDGRIRFYDLRSNERCGVSGFHRSEVADHVDVCFSPDGRRAASVGLDGLRVWDFYPATLGKLAGNQGPMSPLFVAPDGRVIAGTYQVRSPDPGDGRLTEGENPESRNTGSRRVCRPYLYVREGALWRWNEGAPRDDTSCETTAFLAPDAIFCGWNPGGAANGEIDRISPGVGLREQRCFSVHGKVNWVGWWQEERRSLLIGGGDGRLWSALARIGDGQELRLLYAPPEGDQLGPLNGTSQTKDRRYLAACWNGRTGANGRIQGQIVVWHIKDGHEPGDDFEQAYEVCADFRADIPAWQVAFAADRTEEPILAMAGAGREIQLWDVGRQKTLGKLVGHRDAVRQCLTLDDRFLVTSSDDGTVRVWDAVEQEEVCELYRDGKLHLRIAVENGRVTILDGDRVTVADRNEIEQFLAGCAGGDTPTQAVGAAAD